MAKTPAKERIFEKPVAWLVGRDLLGGIKGMILYTAYGSKLDPRDWMTGHLDYDFRNAAGPDQKEFWFDYISDAGDGTKAMYAIAYMVLSDLWHDGSQVTFDNGGELLPRGQFLFFGGDTAYHVADYLTLANRIQRPFTYAFEDLIPHGDIEQRPVFGIPGNHDYYDEVDGFRRQFRKPVRQEPPQPPHSPGGAHAQLGLAGFYRKQEASYVALALPFGWWLWGLDTETGPLDNRQQKFFADITDTDDEDNVIPPRKVIIATSSPSTVFGRVANEEDDFKATKALKALFGDDQPFLPKKRSDGTYDFSVTGDARIESGHCRLDISGDVHHYARYWGPASPGAKPAREHSKSAAPSAESYASVVSGIGGAFHHPTNTYDDELQEQVLYPTEKVSREAVGKQVFDFRSIWGGGYVWLFGSIIAFAIYFALSIAPSTRQVVSNIQFLETIGLMKRESIRPTTSRPATSQPINSQATNRPTTGPCADVKRLGLWRIVAASPIWQPPTERCDPNTPYYFLGTSPLYWPKDLLIGQFLIWASLIVAGVSIGLRTWFFGPKDNDPKRPEDWVDPKPNRKIFLLVVPTAIAVLLGILTVEPYREHVTPYMSSLIVLFTMIVALAGIVLTVRYNDYLFKKGHYEYIKKRDRFWPWALPILSVVVFATGLESFGRNNLPAYLVTDILCTLVFVAAFFGLTFLPLTSVSGELFYTLRPRALAFIGKLLIGFWHAALQLLVPFALVRRGSLLTWILAAFLVILPMVVGPWRLFKNNQKAALTALWILYGALILLLPWLTAGTGTSTSTISRILIDPFFDHAAWVWSGWGLWGFLPCLIAAGVGAVMSCLWFGWYLGICSIFNGHNNEIGGAARIEQFKEFIRFKLTPDGLTGYVIAVDDVSIIGDSSGPGTVKDGRDLKLKLIDVFHLKLKP